VRPISDIVARPDRSVALRAGVVSAREDEGTLGGVFTSDEALHGQVLLREEKESERRKKEARRTETNVDHSVDVVHVAVLPATVMDGILVHGDLGTVEDRGLREGRKVSGRKDEERG
jgi:hypothetical protein